MRYIITLFSIIIYTQITVAQESIFYIVNDPDGWVNVRNNDKKVIDRLINNTLVVVFGDQDEEIDSNWFEVQYNKADSVEYGNVHRSKLKSISKLEKIAIIESSENFCTFSNGSISVQIAKEPFDFTNRTLKYSSEGAWLEYINNKYIWGVDGSIPNYQYKDIEITQNGNRITIPQKALDDLFEPTLDVDYTGVYYDSHTNIIYIVALNGDGAGGYLVGWTIENGKYKERLVTHGF